MQVSLKWINELLNLQVVTLDDLIEKLTLGGFEVEEILELEIENQTQIALDVSATANRSDSLSTQGISIEIGTLLNQQPTISGYSSPIFDWKQPMISLTTTLSTKEEYSSLIGIVVENLTNLTIPKWLTQKLISSGVTPENNLLDFQNYILLETGYPFAFYDYDKICSKLNHQKFSLSISPTNKSETFLASNGLPYSLQDSTLLIKANDVCLGIAGIIEHQDFMYSGTTQSLLIEASVFNAAKIRQQSRNLGLRTDRSARYEKSIKNTFLMESLYRLIWLLRISNPEIGCYFHTATQFVEEEKAPIILHYETVQKILGPVKESTPEQLNYIGFDMITSYLSRLNFGFSYDLSESLWKVKIPESRSDDITSEIDLIEEIGRLHGFNNFLTALPETKVIGKKDWSYQTRSKITSCLLNLGLNEFIHYSLVGETKLIANKVKLINPLLSDYDRLRVSLLPSLVQTIQENLKQGNSLIEGFEYGHVFFEENSHSFNEQERVAGIFGGISTKLSWSDPAIPITWFEAKGKMEQLFGQLNISPAWQTNSSSSLSEILHPYRSAELSFSQNQKLGVFGQIHPKLANRLDLPSDLYLFEFHLEEIQKRIQENQIVIYQEYPVYPKIIKDLSFIIEQKISFQELHETLFFNGTQFLSEIRLLDEYRGPSIPPLSTSLCVQLTFQSNEKTLQNKEIETIINDLQSLLTTKFGAIIRN